MHTLDGIFATLKSIVHDIVTCDIAFTVRNFLKQIIARREGFHLASRMYSILVFKVSHAPPPWPSGRGTPLPCLKLRCVGGRQFDPRPGIYSRMSFSSDPGDWYGFLI